MCVCVYDDMCSAETEELLYNLKIILRSVQFYDLRTFQHLIYCHVIASFGSCYHDNQ